MRSAYKFRIYPTKKQSKIIDFQLEVCRFLYNKTLEEKINKYKEEKKNVSLYELHNLLTVWKNENKEFKKVHSQVLQNVQVRVDLAFQRFFREKNGYPRFKGRFRYRSLIYPQSGFNFSKKKVFLSKIGNIKIVLHRPLVGKVKTVQVVKYPSNKYYVIVSVDEIPKKELPKTNKSVGIDVGVITLATLSNGEKIDNPRLYKIFEKKLEKASRRFSKDKTDKNRHTLSLVHEKLANCRNDFLNKSTLNLVRKFDTICVEKLDIEKMNSYKEVNKSIRDCAWGIFRSKLIQKAESAIGKSVIEVNPVNTSRICSRCGHLNDKLLLTERVFQCISCDYTLDRDLNASFNILRLGIQSLEEKSS